MPVASPPVAPQPTDAAAPLPAHLPAGLYPELKRRVRRAGLLKPQPRYYAAKMVLTAGLAVPAAVVLLHSGHPWWQLATALYLGAVFAQFGFLGHDVGHHQVVRSGRLCTALELLFGNTCVGVSSSWWMAKHNRHHSRPNRTGQDPDITLPVLAFSIGRARAMNRAQQLVVRRQHVLFPVLLLLEGVVLRFSSIQYLVMERGRRWLLEVTLIALHLGLYGWLIFSQLGFYPGIAFVVVHQMAFGGYMGAVFAPNHKGMPVIEDDSNVDFLLEQVLTSRNVHPSALVDFAFGGLNYQIEHHLFPSMPRNRLRLAQPLVEAFCVEHAIPYCQMSVPRAYRDILAHLRTVGAAAR